MILNTRSYHMVDAGERYGSPGRELDSQLRSTNLWLQNGFIRHQEK
jgi:hypothetical protein